MKQLTKRLEAIEQAAAETGGGMAFFQYRDGVYSNAHTGRTYSKEEYKALVARYPEKVFLCWDMEPEPDPLPPGVTVADLDSGMYDEILEAHYRKQEEEEAAWEPIRRELRRRLGDTTEYEEL